MSDFDRRWHELVASSRSAPPSTADWRGTPLDPASAQGIAQRALAHRERRLRQRRELRGMALAAGLCLASLLGLGASGQALGYGPDALAADLARAARSLPRTDFLPAPPRPAELGLTAPDWLATAGNAARVSPARWFLSLDDWLVPKSPAAEHSP